MAVDRWARWYVDIEEVEKWSVGKIATAILHELMHLWCKHHDRLLGKDMFLANMAMDFANNSAIQLMLEDANKMIQERTSQAQNGYAFSQKPPEMAMGDDWLLPKQHNWPDGLAAEEYWDLIDKHAIKVSITITCSGSSKGQPQQNGGGKGQSQNQPQGNQDGSGSSDNAANPHIGKGHCGSCAAGHHDWEDGSPNPADSSKPDGLSEAEMDMLRKRVAREIVEHSRTRGNMPEWMVRDSKRMLKPPRIPWQRELAVATKRAMAWAAGIDDTDWRRFSRRSAGDILLPSWSRPIPYLVGVIDTSGSMGDNQLRKCLEEGQGVLRACAGSAITFIAVDAAVHEVKAVTDIRNFKLSGGGGTDMRIGVDKALERRPRPRIVIVFTDGYTPWHDEPPMGVKVIAVLVVKEAPRPPAYIHSIEAWEDTED